MQEFPITPRNQIFETTQRVLNEAFADGLIMSQLVIRVQHYKDLCVEYGYPLTDAVVGEFVHLLSTNLRKEDHLFRTAPDEFVVILCGLKSQAQTVMAITKIQRNVDAAFSIGEQDIKIVLAIGASNGPGDASKPESLLRCADTALREAERNKLPSVIYAPRENLDCLPSLQLATELESALNDGAIKGHYQPIIDIQTGNLVSVEMLSRWIDGPSGTISPSVFIEAAEKSGLIMPLTLWCLHCGLRESSQWQKVPENVSLAINFSTLVLTDPHLPEVIHSALSLWGLPASRLTVEVTESAIMSDPERCLETLNWLSDQGVKVAIDDFGTGYSSLSYLKQLPVDIIKIDQSFVTNMLHNVPDRNIVQSVIDLARNFGLIVVAEGVEDLHTYDELVDMGCTRIQGYCVSKPMSSEDLEQWCENPQWRKTQNRVKDKASNF
jgi:diguanylate cyclase